MRFNGKHFTAQEIKDYCDNRGIEGIEKDHWYDDKSDDFRKRMMSAGTIGGLHFFINELCAEVESLKSPAPEAGLHDMEYQINGGTVDVHYEYNCGERGTESDPGEHPSVTLWAIYAGQMDLIEDLKEDVLSDIAEKCLDYHQELIRGENTEMSILRYESSRYAD